MKTYKKKAIAKYAFCTSVIALLIGSFYDYDYKIRDGIEKEMEYRAHADTQLMKEEIESKISSIVALLESFSNLALEYDDLSDPAFLKLLDIYADANHYLRMSITLPDGTSYSSNGMQYNAEGREYFDRSIHGETYISNLMTSRLDQRHVISISVPVYRDSETIIGVLRCTLEADKLKDIFHVQTSSIDSLESNVIQNNGDILTMHDQHLSENYFTYLDTVKMASDDTITAIKTAFQKQQNGSFRYTDNNKEEIVFFEPIKNTNWIALTTLPYTIISSRISENYSSLLRLEVKLVFISLAGLTYLFYAAWRNYRNFKSMNQQLDAIITHTPSCILRIRKDSPRDITFINDDLFQLCGYDKDEFYTNLHGDFINLIYKEDREEYTQYATSDYKENEATSNTYRIVHKNGEIIWVFDKRQLIFERHVYWYYVTLVDITETKQIQDKLRISEKRYQMIMEQTQSVMFEWNVKKDEIVFSELWKTKYGYPLFMKNFMKIIHTYDNNTSIVELLEKFIRGAESGSCEMQLRRKDQTRLWCKITARNLKDDDGYIDTIIGSIEDINEVKVHTMHLEEKSKIDGLTGLYNKVTIENYIEQTLLHNQDCVHALFVIDIDDFKTINDSYGHVCGDDALKNIAATLKKCFRSNDFIGRIGGDEFVVFMRNITSNEFHLIKKKANALSNELKEIIISHAPDFHITCSIGIAVHRKGRETYQSLFKKADKALYEVKDLGKDGAKMNE